MIFRLENQELNSYLVCEIEAHDQVDPVSMQMLTNNSKITGLAPLLFTQMDDKKYVKYNISSKITAEMYLQGVVTRKKLLNLLSGILAGMASVDEYMIDLGAVILDPRYIFVDNKTGETNLICLPFVSRPFESDDFQGFLRDMISILQFNTDENCDYVAKLLTYLNGADQISLSDFKNLIITLSNETGEAPVRAAAPARKEVPAAKVSGTGVIVGVPSTPKTPEASKAQPAASRPSREVPPAKSEAAPAQGSAPQAAVSSDPSEKKIGLFYVLMHYSKDNMAKYKAQKNDPAFQKQPKEKKVKEKKNGSMKKNSTELFDIPGVDRADTITGISSEAEIPAPRAEKAAAAPVSGGNVVAASVNKAVQNAQPKQEASTSSSANFGETTVLGVYSSAGETTVLSGGYNNAVKSCVLVRRKNRERVVINKPSFRIGKERSCVDYFIGDNAAISRSHSTINQKQGDYYLSDTNSTNHTYLNGRMLISSEEVKLASGDVIAFADDEFDVEITG